MFITLSEIETEYEKRVQAALQSGEKLTARRLVELSVTLFQELKIEGLSDSEDAECDMLLYQYGAYRFGGEKWFSFDITRQLTDPAEDEPYQLAFTLFFEPEPFEELKSDNCWSSDFASLEDFTAHIKASNGFLLAKKHTPKSYRLAFSRC